MYKIKVELLFYFLYSVNLFCSMSKIPGSLTSAALVNTSFIDTPINTSRVKLSSGLITSLDTFQNENNISKKDVFFIPGYKLNEEEEKEEEFYDARDENEEIISNDSDDDDYKTAIDDEENLKKRDSEIDDLLLKKKNIHSVILEQFNALSQQKQNELLYDKTIQQNFIHNVKNNVLKEKIKTVEKTIKDTTRNKKIIKDKNLFNIIKRDISNEVYEVGRQVKRFLKNLTVRVDEFVEAYNINNIKDLLKVSVIKNKRSPSDARITINEHNVLGGKFGDNIKKGIENANKSAEEEYKKYLQEINRK